MNKREFVRAGAAVVASAGTWPVLAGVRPDRAADDGSLADWQRRVGESFEVYGAAPATRLRLQQVHADRADPALQQFTLRFVGDGAALDSATRVLRRSDGQALALYLDRAGVDHAGRPLLRAHFCYLA